MSRSQVVDEPILVLEDAPDAKGALPSGHRPPTLVPTQIIHESLFLGTHCDKLGLHPMAGWSEVARATLFLVVGAR